MAGANHRSVLTAAALCALLSAGSADAFSSVSPSVSSNSLAACPNTALAAVAAPSGNEEDASNTSTTSSSSSSSIVCTTRRDIFASSALAAALSLGVATGAAPAPAWADEFLDFTGESVMICKKRGPLGACIETVERTTENDNDKASKYFRDPSADVKAKYDSMTREVQSENDGNVLIQKLLQQTEENKERNDRIVKQKTLLNDQGASFGPFSGQVVILNADGEGFTLLQNSQAMRLKEAGYIKDRRFVKQPTKEVIEQALSPPESEGGGLFKSLFGGGAEE